MGYCVKCGAKLNEGAVFCKSCGAKIENVEEKTAVAMNNEASSSNGMMLRTIAASSFVLAMVLNMVHWSNIFGLQNCLFGDSWYDYWPVLVSYALFAVGSILANNWISVFACIIWTIPELYFFVKYYLIIFDLTYVPYILEITAFIILLIALIKKAKPSLYIVSAILYPVSLVLDYIIWKTLPETWLVLGIRIIVAVGIVLLGICLNKSSVGEKAVPEQRE